MPLSMLRAGVILVITASVPMAAQYMGTLQTLMIWDRAAGALHAVRAAEAVMAVSGAEAVVTALAEAPQAEAEEELSD